MKNPKCPDCEIETHSRERKEKVKYKSVKMAINTPIFVCHQCREEFISEEDQRNYDARIKNFRAKVNIADKKVSIH
jgi:YgiT-type zinc finger domain-containing protein